MQHVVKIIGFMIGIGAAVLVASMMRGCDCGSPYPAPYTAVPSDSNYMPVIHSEHRVPIISGTHQVTALPRGVREKDVRRVVSVTLKSGETLRTIETRSGEVLLAKNSAVASIEVTEYTPPIVSLDACFGLGIAIKYANNRATLAPVASFAPVTWYGRLHAPFFTADPEAIGIGAQYLVYHDIAIGAVSAWHYDGNRSIKLTACFMF